MSELVHPFELMELGKAPFRCVGAYEDRGPHKRIIGGVMVEIGAPGQPMGPCAYCGTGIAVCFEIKSSDGKKFVVGSSCVNKTCHKGTRVYNEVEARHNEIKRKARHAREAKNIEQARAWLKDERVREILGEALHPNEGRRDDGEPRTRLDWADWMMGNAGNKGKCDVFRCIKRAVLPKLENEGGEL